MSAAEPPGEVQPPKRARKRPDYDISLGGKSRERACARDFRDILRSAAVASMKWRRSRTLDDADFERAFAFLITSRPRSSLREVVSAASTFAAGGALGYGVTLVTQGGPGLMPGWIIIILAGLAATLAAMFLHWHPAR